jgi:hypothetical protein
MLKGLEGKSLKSKFRRMIHTCLRQPPKLYILDGGKYKKQDGFHFRESSLRFAKKELEELHKMRLSQTTR